MSDSDRDIEQELDTREPGAIGFDMQAESSRAGDEDAGTDVHIRNIKGQLCYDEDGEPITITVAGTYSRTYRRVEAAQRKRPFKGRKLNAQSAMDEQIERVVACTLRWSPAMKAGGAPLPCTPGNAADMYKRCPWVLDDLVEAMNDHERFFTSSSPTP